MERQLQNAAPLVLDLWKRPREELTRLLAALALLEAAHGLVGLPGGRRFVALGIPAGVERALAPVTRAHGGPLDVDADPAGQRAARIDELAHRGALEARDQSG